MRNENKESGKKSLVLYSKTDISHTYQSCMSSSTFQEQSKGLEKEEHLQEDEKGGSIQAAHAFKLNKKKKNGCDFAPAFQYFS